jgi:hypothetical protein
VLHIPPQKCDLFILFMVTFHVPRAPIDLLTLDPLDAPHVDVVHVLNIC